MKKAMLLIIFILMKLQLIQAQDLIELYKTGKIVINPDTSFKSSDMWFNDNDDDLKNYSNIVIDSNENIFILDRQKHQILKFNKNGNFISKYVLNTKKLKSVYNEINELDILDNNFLLVRGYSNIRVLNLNGDLIKIIEFDYPLYDFVALKNNKVGIKGFIGLKNRKTKVHIAIVDIESESEQSAINFIKDEAKEKESIHFKSKIGWLRFTNNNRAPKIFLNRTLDGHLIVCDSGNSEINIYSINEKLINKMNLDYSPLKVDNDDKDEYIQFLKNMLIQLDAPDSILQVIQSPNFFYQYMPYYYDIKVDSDGNILIFKHTKEENHVFRVYQVYSKDGKSICETKLDHGKFETPNLRLINFSKGNLYALLKLKDEDRNSIRLIKTNLKSNY